MRYVTLFVGRCPDLYQHPCCRADRQPRGGPARSSTSSRRSGPGWQRRTWPRRQKNIAEDYTEFNGDAATRVDGRSLSRRIAEAGNKGSGHTHRRRDAQPQGPGSTVTPLILSYNFFGLEQDKDGKVKPTRAKSSRVYVKQDGKSDAGPRQLRRRPTAPLSNTLLRWRAASARSGPARPRPSQLDLSL